MTRIVCKRCTKCGVSYSFQASGHGAHEFNDEKWCHDCAAVVYEALKTRPRLFECRYRDVKELNEYYQIPLETLLAWEQDNIDRKKKAGGFESLFATMHRVWPALVNTETGECQSCREIWGQGKHSQIGFRLTQWMSKPEEYKIEVPMEWDVLRKQWTGDEWRY